MPSAIVCSAPSFSWPDGTTVLSGLSAAFSPGRTGLVAVSMSGKSALLRLTAGRLTPKSGRVSAVGDASSLPQRLNVLDQSLTSAENVRAAAPGASPGRGRDSGV
jgi:ABC-type polysaccharide/polyol phosphate transport system ATPase subunit